MFALFVLLGAPAYAQECIPAPYTMGQQQRCWDGRLITGNVGGVVVGQQQIGGYNTNGVQLIAPAAALANGLSKCEVVGGIAGGTLGSFAKNHNTQGVVLGAILGGIVGNAVCSNNQGQQILVVQQPPQGQQQVVGQRQMPPAQVVPVTAEAQQQGLQVPGGDLRCPLRFNGQEVQVFMVKDPDACMAVVEYEARRRGWVRQ